MKALRAFCALVMVAGWLSLNGALSCSPLRASHRACPMHGSADGDTGAHVAAIPANHACHDAGVAAHCVPGQPCSALPEALSPDLITLWSAGPLRSTSIPSADRWRSCDTSRIGPPPKPANLTA